MNRAQQPWLSNLEEVERIKRQRKLPQPKLARPRPIKKFEILHRPFDLRFRGRLNKWLSKLIEVRGFALEQTLDPIKVRLIKLYLFPRKRDNKWLRQKEVAERISGMLPYKIRMTLISALVEIWEKSR